MSNHKNPFYMFEEAMQSLKLAGADPRSLSTTWQEGVIGIYVSKEYDLESDFYKYSVHLNSKSFKEVSGLLGEGYPVVKEHCFVDYDSYTIKVGSQVELYKLELKDSEVRKQ